jgi:hypothetical protein
MRRLLAISAVFLVSACVAGRSGIIDSEGGVVQIDASWRLRDGGSHRDGSTVDRDGSTVDRDGSTIGRDGSTPFPDGSLPSTELTCDDSVDQDGDGATDCADDDCDDAPCGGGSFCSGMVCGGCRDEPSETSCGDGADEDCDGMTDCADPECAGVACGPGGAVCSASGTCPCASGFTERICGDANDDDCDGLIDCADLDCEGRSCAASGMVCRSGACTCNESFEFCNDRDEDCDGVIDDGCPEDLTFCCPAALGPFGGGAGAFSDPCPTGSVLMGIAGRSSGRLDRVQPICAALFMSVDLRIPENAYPVIRDAPVLGAIHGGTGGTAFDDRCPDGDVVIGVRGGTDELGNTLTGIGLSCGTVRVVRTGLSWQRTITPTVETPLRGSSGFTPFDVDCEGGVITAVSGQAGTGVSGLAFTCDRLTLETL